MGHFTRRFLSVRPQGRVRGVFMASIRWFPDEEDIANGDNKTGDDRTE